METLNDMFIGVVLMVGLGFYLFLIFLIGKLFDYNMYLGLLACGAFAGLTCPFKDMIK